MPHWMVIRTQLQHSYRIVLHGNNYYLLSMGGGSIIIYSLIVVIDTLLEHWFINQSKIPRMSHVLLLSHFSEKKSVLQSAQNLLELAWGLGRYQKRGNELESPICYNVWICTFLRNLRVFWKSTKKYGLQFFTLLHGGMRFTSPIICGVLVQPNLIVCFLVSTLFGVSPCIQV